MTTAFQEDWTGPSLAVGSTPESNAARRALRTFAIVTCALAIVALPVLAQPIHPALSFAAIILATTLAYFVSPALAISAMLFGGLFQNLFVSLVSPAISGKTAFDLVRGYNFVILMMVWGLAWLDYLIRWRQDARETNRLIKWTSVTFAVILAYLALGMLEGLIPAFIYLRNIASGLLMFQAALIASRYHKLDIGPILAATAGIVIVLGYVELVSREQWLVWTNGYDFWNLARIDQIAAGIWDKNAQTRGIVVLGLIDSFRVEFLNTPLLADLDLEMLRLFGPNMHPISYAYALSFLTIYTLFTARFVLAALLAPLLFCANAKGALITLFLTVIAYGLSKLLGIRVAFAALAAMLVAYVLIGIIVGLNIGDFHVLGLMGGIYNFIEYPIGHGVGVGGNLAVDFEAFDWSAFQAAGRTPIAVESSVGVLLYQMGIGAFAVFTCYGWLATRLVALARETRHPLHLAAGFALAVTAVNGFFQEEALFSPLGIAWSLALAGLVLGSSYRAAES